MNYANPATYEGPVDVRVLSKAEIDARAGTPWNGDDGGQNGLTAAEDGDLVYEITFQGEVHDTLMLMTAPVSGSALTLAPVLTPCEEQVTLLGAPFGTPRRPPTPSRSTARRRRCSSIC